MAPNREYDLCCGGGGGLDVFENQAFTEKTGKAKVNQIKETGATVLGTSCEDCHRQLGFLNERYHLGVRVEFLTNMAADSLSPE